MKKLLALVLALVMTLGLATVGTNAAFADQDAVDASEYWEAITVLNGMGVFKGYEDDEFKPEAKITRAQVAAIIYRIYTGDVDDESIANYVNLGNFSDVKPTDWYAGYVGYCANAKFIKGYGDGTFQPDRKISGYEALAMILRAVGYNAQNDFEGADYWVKVAEVAEQYKMLDNIAAEDLTGKAPRATIAEILFDAIKVSTVNWLPALGYQNRTAASIANNGAVNKSLAEENFDLVGPADKTDAWGVLTRVWGTKSDDDAYATIAVKPSATYYTAVPECDVAHDVGATATVVYDVYLNGRTDDGTTTASQTAGIIGVGDRDTDIDSITTTTGLRTNKVQIVPTATVATIGGQGRETLVYYKAGVDGDINRVVMVDTFLAEVTAVANATYDANNHLATPATIRLNVFTTGNAANQAGATDVYVTNGKTNYTFATKDYVLFQAKTVAVGGNDNVRMDNNRLNGGSATNFLFKTGTNIVTGAANEVASLKLVEKAASIEGKQTTLHFNDGKHEINNTLYNDAIELHLDEAGVSTANYIWFLDKQGNIIGDVLNVPTSYAIIKDIQWINPVGAAGYARATLLTMDGTEIVTDASTAALVLANIDSGAEAQPGANKNLYTTSNNGIEPVNQRLDGDGNRNNNKALVYADNTQYGNIANGSVSTNYSYNNAPAVPNGWNGQHLYQIGYNANGFMTLASDTRTTANTTNSTKVFEAQSVVIRTGVPSLRWASGAGALTAVTDDIGANHADNSIFATMTSQTKFLIRTVNAAGQYEYQSVTGYENVPSYTNTNGSTYARVDYVMDADNRYVEFAFITGTPDEAAATVRNDFVFLTTGSTAVSVGTAVTYRGRQFMQYAISGLIHPDGSNKVVNLLVPANVATGAFTTNLANSLTAAKGTLRMITLRDDYVVWNNNFNVTFPLVDGVQVTEGNIHTGTTASRLSAEYEGMVTAYDAANSVLTANGMQYNILNSTNIVTEDGTTMTKAQLATLVNNAAKGVYVVTYAAGAGTNALYEDVVALYITAAKGYALTNNRPDDTARNMIDLLLIAGRTIVANAGNVEAATPTGGQLVDTMEAIGNFNKAYEAASVEAKNLAETYYAADYVTTTGNTTIKAGVGTVNLRTALGAVQTYITTIVPGTDAGSTNNFGTLALAVNGRTTPLPAVVGFEDMVDNYWENAFVAGITAATTDAAIEAAWNNLTTAQKNDKLNNPTVAGNTTLQEAKDTRDGLALAALYATATGGGATAAQKSAFVKAWDAASEAARTAAGVTEANRDTQAALVLANWTTTTLGASFATVTAATTNATLETAWNLLTTAQQAAQTTAKQSLTDAKNDRDVKAAVAVLAAIDFDAAAPDAVNVENKALGADITAETIAFIQGKMDAVLAAAPYLGYNGNAPITGVVVAAQTGTTFVAPAAGASTAQATGTVTLTKGNATGTSTIAAARDLDINNLAAMTQTQLKTLIQGKLDNNNTSVTTAKTMTANKAGVKALLETTADGNTATTGLAYVDCTFPDGAYAVGQLVTISVTYKYGTTTYTDSFQIRFIA